MAEIGKDTERAATFLRKGEVIGIPTETVYGLAGNALETSAVSKIFRVKNRPKFDPLIVHIHSKEEISALVRKIPEPLRQLLDVFWPGPLTILVEKKNIIPDLVTAGSPLVAVRVPDHPLTLDLLSKLDFPLAAPSANPFGYVSPTSAVHVDAQLGADIPYILDGGEPAVGLESTIVGFSDGRLTVHRLGGLNIEDLKKHVPKIHFALNKNSNPVAPGMLKTHYAPNKKVMVGDIETLLKAHQSRKIGVLSFYKKHECKHQFILSPRKSLDEAARNLFAGLRYFDQVDVDIVITEKFPERGLGLAINDRLQRASAP